MRIILVFIIIFGLYLNLSAQNNSTIDSLLNVYNNTNEDTLRIKLLNEKIGYLYENINSDSAIFFYNQAIDIANNNLQKSSNKSLQTIFVSLKAKSLRYIGIVYRNMGNYQKAIEYNFQALEIYEKLGDENGMANCYGNIGIVYRNQKYNDKAIEYFLMTLEIKEKLQDKVGMAQSYNNIALVLADQGVMCKNPSKKDSLNNKAIEYYEKALRIAEEQNNKKGMAICLSNIGIVLMNINSYDRAIEYNLRAIKIYEEIDDKNGIAMMYDNNSNLNIILSDSTALSEGQRIMYLNKAIDYGSKALLLARELGAVPWENNAALHLQKAYSKLGNYKEAIKYAEIYIDTKDLMFNEEKTKALAEMGTKYESEKKQLELEKMQKQKELDNKTIEAQQSKNKKQQIIIFSAIAGLLIVLGFLLIILRLFRQKRKDNVLLAQQKDEIEEKNRDILDSINYAKRIQSAILPPMKIVKEYLKESFILYKPKAIVAGDFYWMEHKDGKILFAAADCTGHGVPGAMVSVVCNNGLNRSVREHGLSDPGKILDKTREIVVREFEKSEDDVSDGMDIAICSLEGNILKYAGANNPLWIIRNGELIETKADNQPIGKSWKEKAFTTNIIELQERDTLYIFSDGYVDQFGGENAKKFKSKALKELLLSIQDKGMDEQRLILDVNFEAWKGKLEQIDDVCIIGVRI